MTAHAITPRADSRLVPTATLAGALAVVAAAWIVLIHRMAGMTVTSPTMNVTQPTLGSLGWFVITWLVMTAAMMLPGTAPAVARVVRGRGSTAPATAVGFVAGYGAVWLLAGLAGYACVQAVRALHVSALDWSSAGRYVAAGAVIGAGLYQFTPIKRRWLARCTAPDRHLPRPGVFGALRAGAGHGVCCVACCWTLMVALYALGFMSVTWMVVLTVLIAGERLLARHRAAVPAVAVVLVVLGVGVAARVGGGMSMTIPPTGHPAMGMGTRAGMGTDEFSGAGRS
jgi:predicted metal-binding membrane protein